MTLHAYRKSGVEVHIREHGVSCVMLGRLAAAAAEKACGARLVSRPHSPLRFDEDRHDRVDKQQQKQR